MHEIHEDVKKMIEEEKRHNKKRFPWNAKPTPGEEAWMLPRFTPAKDVHNVPHLVKMEDARMTHMNEARSVAQYNVYIAKLRGVCSRDVQTLKFRSHNRRKIKLITWTMRARFGLLILGLELAYLVLTPYIHLSILQKQSCTPSILQGWQLFGLANIVGFAALVDVAYSNVGLGLAKL